MDLIKDLFSSNCLDIDRQLCLTKTDLREALAEAVLENMSVIRQILYLVCITYVIRALSLFYKFYIYEFLLWNSNLSYKLVNISIVLSFNRSFFFLFSLRSVTEKHNCHFWTTIRTSKYARPVHLWWSGSAPHWISMGI